jgi:SRSO17 transposase
MRNSSARAAIPSRARNSETKGGISAYGSAADADLKTLAATIKARWVCEQARQQINEELGLDHFEGRSWHGLHRHALMTMIAYAYSQSRRLAAASGEKRIAAGPPQLTLPDIRHLIVLALAHAPPYRCPNCRLQIRQLE